MSLFSRTVRLSNSKIKSFQKSFRKTFGEFVHSIIKKEKEKENVLLCALTFYAQPIKTQTGLSAL